MTARVFSGGVTSPMLFRLGGLAWMICGFGCASPAPPPPATAAQAVTRLIVSNQTNYDWHLTVARPSGAEKSETDVAARATVTLSLAGGDYVIEQTAAGVEGAAALSRRVPVHLVPGRTYHWRIDTLLSDDRGRGIRPATVRDAPP